VIFLYILGGALVILGIFGVVGGHKKNACMLGVYNFGAILALVLFIIIGAIAYGVTAVFSHSS
jgi:hypothetical protein